jgi:hypothetical protein
MVSVHCGSGALEQLPVLPRRHAAPGARATGMSVQSHTRRATRRSEKLSDRALARMRKTSRGITDDSRNCGQIVGTALDSDSRAAATCRRSQVGDADGLTDLVAQLVGAGVATRGGRQARGRSASIRVHGRGPLSDLLVEALRCSGPGLRIPASRMPLSRRRPQTWWCWRTTSLPTRAWSAICTARASRTFPSGCATAPGWWGRWSFRARPAVW